VIALFGAYLYLLPMPAAQTRGPLLGHLKTGAALAGAAAAAGLIVLLAFRLRGGRAMVLVDRLLSTLHPRLSQRSSRAVRAFRPRTQAFGVDKATAAAAAITGHAFSTLPVLRLGLMFLGREGLTFGKVAEMTAR